MEKKLHAHAPINQGHHNGHTHAPNTEENEWDAFLASHPGAHHEQSSRFGSNRELYGYRCERVVLRGQKKIIGGAQIMVQATPVGRLGMILRGPLAVNDDPATMAATVAKIDELARQRGYASLRVETFPTQAAARRALEDAGFAAGTAWFGRRPSQTVLLECSDELLLAQMKAKGRYNTRLASRNGVTIEVGDTASLADFYHLHQMTAAHQGFPVFPKAYYEYLWRVFGPRRLVQHFLAYHHGKPVAAIFNALVDGRMYYCAGGLHRGPAERRLMANYLLHFQAMGWARDHGCSHYDLVGVTPFKEKIAPELIHWPLPLRKYYGPGRLLRRHLTTVAWEKATLRRGVERIAAKLGLKQPMPW